MIGGQPGLQDFVSKTQNKNVYLSTDMGKKILEKTMGKWYTFKVVWKQT